MIKKMIMLFLLAITSSQLASGPDFLYDSNSPPHTPAGRPFPRSFHAGCLSAYELDKIELITALEKLAKDKTPEKKEKH